MSKAKSNKIAFLDRDGIINVDHGYVHKTSEFEFVEGFTELFSSLIENGFIPVVVTNQSGVARGYFNLDQVDEFHSFINSKLLEQTGSKIEYIYVCPHHTKGTVEKYTLTCKCRKPETGMIESFERDFGNPIDYSKSIMIGDKKSDIELGLAKNLISIQLNSGKYEIHPNPTYTVKNLRDIIPIIK